MNFIFPYFENPCIFVLDLYYITIAPTSLVLYLLHPASQSVLAQFDVNLQVIEVTRKMLDATGLEPS